ncbi:MAG TPA: hypothetical protein VK991_01395 [Halomonas sp.]|nr:hypothetical protein [Halomonas sp.]
MIWHLIAVLIVGLSAGGITLLLRKISRNRLPKWTIPLAAGVGMFGYQAYYDYTWYDWKKSQLPDSAIILDEQRNSNFFRPWSYLYPAVNYLAFIDGDHRDFRQDGQHLVQYVLYELYHEYTDRLENNFYLLNCEALEQIRLGDNGTAAPAAETEHVERDSPLYRTFCS